MRILSMIASTFGVRKLLAYFGYTKQSKQEIDNLDYLDGYYNVMHHFFAEINSVLYLHSKLSSPKSSKPLEAIELLNSQLGSVKRTTTDKSLNFNLGALDAIARIKDLITIVEFDLTQLEHSVHALSTSNGALRASKDRMRKRLEELGEKVEDRDTPKEGKNKRKRSRRRGARSEQ